MADTTIYPYGQNQPIPTGYPIADDLVTDSAQQALSARQGVRLKAMIDDIEPTLVVNGGYHYSPTRQLALTANGTSKEVQYPLFKDSIIHFGLALGSSVSGTTYLIAKVNSSSEQKVLLSIPSGDTTAEADITVDKRYDYITVYNESTSLASATITLEVTHKAQCTGYDNVASVIQTAYDSQWLNWRRTIVKIPVKKGNMLYFCGYGSAGSTIVFFHETYTGNYTASWGNKSGLTAELIEGFITFSQDGYIRIQTFDANYTPLFILYADERIKDEIVVAAANTPDGIKQQADYICTGVNDEVILNELIQGSRLLGRSIKMLRGTYYLDAPTKQNDSANDSFLLIETSPLDSNTAQYSSSTSVIIYGEDPFHRPALRISNSAYESLDGSKQYSALAIKDTTQYGGFVELRNIRILYPSNQKKICAIDMLNYGGWARLHSVHCTAYISGYNGQEISISNPPRRAVDGCIGIRFIGKGPNGAYGSEMTDCMVSGFNEGICINTEWTVCEHVASIFCVTGWVFGKYTSSTVHASTHPLVLICCGDERSNSHALFYNNSGLQQIEMIAFSIERDAQNCPQDAQGNKYLDTLARVQEGTGYTKEFRGSISYTTYNPHSSTTANNVDIGFWEFGHGHGMKTTDASHAQAGTTALRNTYRPNFMQRYFDTSLGTNGKEIICIDESGNNGKGTWVDAAGNIV